MADTPTPAPARRPFWGIRLARWWSDFFGPTGTIGIVVVCVASVGLYLVWEQTEWKAYVSAAAGGLTALVAALAPLIRDTQAGAKWTLATAAIVFAAIVPGFATYDLQRDLKEQTEITNAFEKRLGLQQQFLTKFMSELQVTEKERFLTEAGVTARERFGEAIGGKPPFPERIFGPSKDLLDIIQSLDRDNGHYHYLKGDTERVLKGISAGRPRFRAYLEIEKGRTLGGELGAMPCRNPKGLCAERTAWIYHLLANDLYTFGVDEKNKRTVGYKVSFETAYRYTCAVFQYFPGGFIDAKQYIPTPDLEQRLNSELGISCPKK